jgi:hypothetical protein
VLCVGHYEQASIVRLCSDDVRSRDGSSTVALFSELFFITSVVLDQWAANVRKEISNDVRKRFVRGFGGCTWSITYW